MTYVAEVRGLAALMAGTRELTRVPLLPQLKQAKDELAP